jgi:hypothetical protein
MLEKSEAPINKTGASEECGSTPTLRVARPVKSTARTLRQLINTRLFCDGLRLRGNNLVELYSDGPLPRLYSPGHEPIFEANVDPEMIAKSLGVLA